MIKKSVLLTALAIAGFAVTSLAQTVPNYVPTNGLVGWWPFNGNAIDESSNTNDGIVYPNTVLTIDRANNPLSAYLFDGTTQSGIQTNTPISYTVTGLSASVWFNSNIFLNVSAGHKMFISGTNNIPFQFSYNNGGIDLELYNQGGQLTVYTIPAIFTANTWHHVLFSASTNNSVKIYIDGVLSNAANAPSLFRVANNSTYIFGLSSSAFFPAPFNGKLDDIGIWNRALTPQEIANLYQSCSNPPTASITPQGNTTFCQGNSVILAASTGTGNTYQWYANNSAITSATNANYPATQSGSYSVVVTNVACTATSSAVQVTVNNLPTVTANVTNSVVCLGQTTTLSGGGANTYVWTGGVTNGIAFNPTVTATYTVTGTAATGCTNTASRQITVNNLPTVTANVTNSVVCLGQSTTLSGGGANTYVWTGGVTNGVAFNPTVTAIYTVTGTAATGCTNTASRQITVNNLPTVIANVTNSVVCLGQSTILSGSGGTSYTWTGGITNGVAFTPTATANYTVTGTGANGCTNKATRQITVNNLPTVTMAPLGSFVNINAAPISLLGNPSGGTYSGAGVTGNVFNPLNAGLGAHHVSYSYVDANGCGGIANNNTIVYDTLGTVCTSYDTVFVSVTDTLIINTIVTGVNPPNNNNTIKVFPNPAKDHITIDYGNYVLMNGYSVKITNALGQVMFISAITQQSSYINIFSWTGNGIYFVNIINPQGNTIDIRKIVLQ